MLVKLRMFLMLLKESLRQQLQPTYRWMEEVLGMNLLFIHGNFPGQFKDIAPALAGVVVGELSF